MELPCEGRLVMRKRILSIILVLTLVITMAAPASFAASGKKVRKMKVADLCLKSGDLVFCNTCDGLYRVNLKTGKKTKYCVNQLGGSMHYHKGYLYFTSSYYVDNNNDSCFREGLYRLNLKTKKVKRLYTATKAADDLKYAIKGNKIYTQYTRIINDNNGTKTVRKVMKLNGKHKRNSKYKVRMTGKINSTKGYYIYYDRSEYDQDIEIGWESDYLKTPKHKIFLCRYYRE